MLAKIIETLKITNYVLPCPLIIEFFNLIKKMMNLEKYKCEK